MLKKPKSERPRRWSLLLPFTRIVLVILVITTLIVGIAVYFLISYGMLENLATTLVVGVHKLVEQIPNKQLRDPMINGIADTIRNTWKGRG